MIDAFWPVDNEYSWSSIAAGGGMGTVRAPLLTDHRRDRALLHRAWPQRASTRLRAFWMASYARPLSSARRSIWPWPARAVGN